jgi:hypothetical protein
MSAYAQGAAGQRTSVEIAFAPTPDIALAAANVATRPLSSLSRRYEIVGEKTKATVVDPAAPVVEGEAAEGITVSQPRARPAEPTLTLRT